MSFNEAEIFCPQVTDEIVVPEITALGIMIDNRVCVFEGGVSRHARVKTLWCT